MTLSCIKHQFFKTSQSYTVPFNGAMKNTRFPSQRYVRLVRPGCIPTMGLMIIPQSSRSKMVQAFKPLPSLGSFGGFDASGCSGSWQKNDRNGWKCDWIMDTTRHTSWSNNIKVLRIIIWIIIWIIMNYPLLLMTWGFSCGGISWQCTTREYFKRLSPCFSCISWLSFSRTSAPSVLSTCHRFYSAKRLERARQGVSKDLMANGLLASSDDSHVPSWFTSLYCRCRLALREAQGASTPEEVSVASWKHQTLDQAGKLSL